MARHGIDYSEGYESEERVGNPSATQAYGTRATALPAAGGYETVSPASLIADAFPRSTTGRVILIVVAIAIGVLSFFLIGPWASSPETYADTIASLDEKRNTVLGFIGGATGLSGAITLLPGDAGTPIAEKLLDIGSDFGIVLGAIYLEKYLLTVLGFAAFKILIPVACVLLVVAALLSGRGERYRELFVSGAAKLALFGIAIAVAVPVSVFVSDAIDATYQDTAEATLAASEELADEAQETSELAAGEAAGQAATDGQLAQEGEADQESLGGIAGLVQTITGAASEAVDDVTAQAQEALNDFIETLAVMIVTSCVIPLLVLLFFLWLAKTILGLNVSVPVQALAPRSLRRFN